VWLERDILFDCSLRQSGGTGAGVHGSSAGIPFAIFLHGSRGGSSDDEATLQTYDPQNLVPLGGMHVAMREWPPHVRVSVAQRQGRGIHMEPLPPDGGGVFHTLRIDPAAGTAQVAVLPTERQASDGGDYGLPILYVGHCRIVDGVEARPALGTVGR
jgi:hypothetical protein